MVKPVLKRTNSPHTAHRDYQQALDDFGITELMQKLNQLALKSQELEEIELPANLSDRLPPNYEVGDRVCWIPISEETDVGMIIGRFLAPAPHQSGQWTWQYLIKLDQDSPSSRWVVADIAFEEDLEPVALEVSR